jgi:hypothetical protein
MRATIEQLEAENQRLTKAMGMALGINQSAKEAINALCDNMAELVNSLTPEQNEIRQRCLTIHARFDGILSSWQPTDGALLIQEERRQQLTREGYTPEHDDKHVIGELLSAANCYTVAGDCLANGAVLMGSGYLETPENLVQEILDNKFGNAVAWPWEKDCLKISPDSIRNLVKAGALIAAEIDRLKRLEARKAANAS